MITVKNVHQRQFEGKSFVTLELTGGLEMLQSQKTGRFYATAKRCFIGSTFTYEQAKQFIGQKMSGSIIRVSCDPYEYRVPDSGEIVSLSHTYTYQPEEGPETQAPEEKNLFDEIISTI